MQRAQGAAKLRTRDHPKENTLFQSLLKVFHRSARIWNLIQFCFFAPLFRTGADLDRDPSVLEAAVQASSTSRASSGVQMGPGKMLDFQTRCRGSEFSEIHVSLLS